jgi:hypothetical protein
MIESIPKKVSISDKKQLEFWCSYFSCTPNDLDEALNKMGTCTDEVQIYLRERPGKRGLNFWFEYMK